MVNRDLLGWVRRALRMGASPPSPELIGIIQPAFDPFMPTPEDFEIVREITTVNVAAGAESIRLGGTNKHGFIVHGQVSFTPTARTLSASLEVETDAIQHSLTVYNAAAANTHLLTAEGDTLQRSTQRIYYPPGREGSETTLRLNFGAGLIGEVMTTVLLVLRLDRFDPIPR